MPDWLAAIGWVPTATPLSVLGARLCAAVLIGAIIGLEREMDAKDAGLRTHMLVSLASALFILLVFEIYASVGSPGGSGPDPVRAVGAVTAGVAFLGAGVIFRESDRVKGLKTGAGMWLTGAIGTACALGRYGIALVAAVLGFVVLRAFKRSSSIRR